MHRAPFISGALNGISRITRESLEIKGSGGEIFIADLGGCGRAHGRVLRRETFSEPPANKFAPRYYLSRAKNLFLRRL